MKSSRNFVRILVKLSSGTDLGHDHLKGRDPLFFMDPYRDSSSVIFCGNRIIFIYDNTNGITVACKGFINRVVYDFIDQMVQSSDAHITDIHGGTHTYVLHSFEGLNTVCRILWIWCCFTHIWLYYNCGWGILSNIRFSPCKCRV